MNSTCSIPPNSEIAGIGIRTSIYAQAFLGCIVAGLALYRYASEYGEAFVPHKANDLEHIAPSRSEIELLFHSELPTNDVLRRLHRTYLRDEKEDRRDLRLTRVSLQITGAALLIAAGIQATLYGLDVYHALIVLNLAWLINVTLVTLYLAELYLLHPTRHFLRYPFPPKFFTFQNLRNSEVFLPMSLYLSGLGAYGLWLFSHLSTFGSIADCNSEIDYWLFGNRVPVTSRGFRIGGLVIHAVIACPLLNVVEELFLSCRISMGAELISQLPMRLARYVFPKHEHTELGVQVSNFMMVRTMICVAASYLFLMIIFVLGTEEMIGVNFNLVDAAVENEWTFGQILVLLLLLPIVFDLFGKVKEIILHWKDQKVEDRRVEDAVLQLRRSPNSGEKGAQNGSADGAREAKHEEVVERTRSLGTGGKGAQNGSADGGREPKHEEVVERTRSLGTGTAESSV